MQKKRIVLLAVFLLFIFYLISFVSVYAGFGTKCTWNTANCFDHCSDEGWIIVELGTGSDCYCKQEIFNLSNYTIYRSFYGNNPNIAKVNNVAVNLSAKTLVCGQIYKIPKITPCGETSDEDFFYQDENGNYKYNLSQFCSVSNEVVCDGKNLIEEVPTGKFNETTCQCEKTRKILDVCFSSDLCDSENKKCIPPDSGLAIDVPSYVLVKNNSVVLRANQEIKWRVYNDKNVLIVFNDVGTKITLQNLSIGEYFIEAEGLVKTIKKSFLVIKCKSDNDCLSGQKCFNKGTIDSFCKKQECTSDEQCLKIIKSVNPLAYDIHCINPNSADSYCSYKNITCLTDDDCKNKVPEDAKNVKCIDGGTKKAYCSFANCPVACGSDIDCDDGDQDTYDYCQLPKTCQAQCVHELKFVLLEPEKKTYTEIPKLNYKIYKNLPCKFWLNGKLEIITRLPVKLRNVKLGNNSFKIECGKTIKYNSWFIFGEQQKINKTKIVSQNFGFDQVFDSDKANEIIRKSDEISNKIKITKDLIEENGTTMVKTTLELNDNESLRNLDVYVRIPKCMAQSIKELDFDNDDFKVLIDDPLIMWHFKEITSKENLIYRVKNKVNKECFDQLKILTAKSTSNDNWWIYVALIPVILFVYAFFSQFAVHDEEEKDIEAVENYVRLLRRRVNRLRKEFNDERIKMMLEEEGIEEKIIEKALK